MKTGRHPFLQLIRSRIKRLFSKNEREKQLTLFFSQTIEFKGVIMYELSGYTTSGEQLFFQKIKPNQPLHIHIPPPSVTALQPLDQLFSVPQYEKYNARYCSLVVLGNQDNFFLIEQATSPNNKRIESQLEYYFVDRDVQIETIRSIQINEHTHSTDSSSLHSKQHKFIFTLHLSKGWNRVCITQQSDNNGDKTSEYSTLEPENQTPHKWLVRPIRPN